MTKNNDHYPMNIHINEVHIHLDERMFSKNFYHPSTEDECDDCPVCCGKCSDCDEDDEDSEEDESADEPSDDHSSARNESTSPASETGKALAGLALVEILRGIVREKERSTDES